MSTFVGRTNKWSRLGRVNGENLFAFNKNLKVQTLDEKHFWQVNADLHPINRWSFLRWNERKRKEGLFEQRINSLPPDQMKAQKWMVGQMKHITWLLPLGVVIYTLMCYMRFQVWGVTPNDAGLSLTRFVHGSARAPTHTGSHTGF